MGCFCWVWVIRLRASSYIGCALYGAAFMSLAGSLLRCFVTPGVALLYLGGELSLLGMGYSLASKLLHQILDMRPCISYGYNSN